MKDLAAELAEAVLDPDERLAFLEVCRPAEPEELAARVADVDAHLGRIRAVAAADPTVDLGLAERIAAALRGLLGAASGYAYEERRLVMGAVEYFVLDGDSSDDVGDLFGLDDDARIVGAVCRLRDRHDLAEGW